MSDNELPIPEGYSPESFGQIPDYPSYPTQQEKSGRGGRWFALFGCGGISVAALLCCCCCIAGSILLMREPFMIVTLWGSGGTAESWDLSEMFTCDGSQARALTREFADQGAYFSTFNPSGSVNFGDDEIEASGVLRTSGRNESWSATFYTQSRSSFMSCIYEIDVHE